MNLTVNEKEQLLNFIDEKISLGKSIKSISDDLGISRQAIYRLRKGRERNGKNGDIIEMPDIMEDDISIEEIIDQRKKEFRKKYDTKEFLRWYPIKVKKDEPIGITFIGDPHLDNDGTNWVELERDINILKNTDNLFAVGIGDFTDNWTGRLERLYANSNTAKSRGLKLMEWFILDSGIKWMSLIAGNHDQWSGPESALKFICKENGIHLLDSINRFELQFPNGEVCKVDARHDFHGNSMWNSLHALQKAAHMKEPANVYVAGHRHNWAYHTEESASKDFVYHLIRVRGYKHIDDYAVQLGHDEQKYGSSISIIIDPRYKSTHPNFVTVFIDIKLAAEYLNFIRTKN